ncbi:hypothetical protein N780_02130 [Pontibacillus chungwhensis BH030062]|uniref:Uncharacterized protein n=1 Tax=Pontibacillus chungwhensis BH030062 TaxID=1385513 RepID=A0A0A2VFM3_9BACI|nr:hypothetical protein N780_02130 [Pontibacillus chungwhensis BH030062]
MTLVRAVVAQKGVKRLKLANWLKPARKWLELRGTGSSLEKVTQAKQKLTQEAKKPAQVGCKWLKRMKTGSS